MLRREPRARSRAGVDGSPAGRAMQDTVVDSHQHFWEVGRFEYPWMSPEVAVLYRDYTPADLEPLLREHGVGRTVLVQASNSVEETRWMLALADAHPFVAGVVGWVDLASPEAGRQLDDFARHPKFKGVRHLVESEPDDWLAREDALGGMREVAARGLAFDLLVHTRHLRHVPALADRVPGLRMVVDHMAKPPIASGAIDEWADAIGRVADVPGVRCKLSGLVTEASHGGWAEGDLRPYVERALDLFGAGRMMFGSDYPVCLLAADYGRVLGAFRALLAGLGEEDRRRVFSENAEEFYGL
jgi:L-fuconolactonase